MEKKILITGHAGLLGSRLAEWILQNIPDAIVVGIDDLSGGYETNIPKNTISFIRNITDPLEDIFATYKFDYVFHLAAYAAECLSPFIRQFNYTSNLVATANIVNNCIKYGVKRLVFTSSIAAYGQPLNQFGNQAEVFFEEYQCVPKDPYGVAKLACEMDIKIAGDQHGLDWCILRPHNIIGRNQNIWDKYRNVVGIWMFNKLNSKPITIYGDGTQTRAFSIIDDMLEPIWKSAVLPEASKQIINLGGTTERSINDLAKIVQRVTNNSSIEYLESRYEVKHAYPSPVKSEKILGYKEIMPLEAGIKNMWQWAQQQPQRKQIIWKEYELDTGVYSYWKNK